MFSSVNKLFVASFYRGQNIGHINEEVVHVLTRLLNQLGGCKVGFHYILVNTQYFSGEKCCLVMFVLYTTLRKKNSILVQFTVELCESSFHSPTDFQWNCTMFHSQSATKTCKLLDKPTLAFESLFIQSI